MSDNEGEDDHAAYMLLVPSLKLGIDYTIALAVIHYRYGLSFYHILIAFPYTLKIFAACHKLGFLEFMAQRYSLYSIMPKKQLSAYCLMT